MTYLRCPSEIYRRSFSIARSEARLDGLDEAEAAVAVRIIHACGMPQLGNRLLFSERAVSSGQEALDRGGSILCDSLMVAAGISRRFLHPDCVVRTTIDSPQVPALATSLATTRSAAAVELWRPFLSNAVIAIGNAPTALFRLLEILQATDCSPALIIGMPVGFVGAAESKEALLSQSHGVPYITLPGRLGGSAMASAAVNAVARLSQWGSRMSANPESEGSRE